MFGNVRKVGQVIAGPVIAVGSSTHLGYGGVFAVCAGFTTLALVVVLVSRRAVPELSARPA